MMNCSID